MSLRSFTHDLRRGLGSAIIELKTNPNNDEYRVIVARSCLKDIAYDTQVEGTKGFYLYTAFKTFANPETFLESVAAKFEGILYWRLSEQLYDILCCFSSDGYKFADEVLEKKCEDLIKRLPITYDCNNGYCEREQLEKLMVRKLDSGFGSFKQCIIDMGKMITAHGNDECLWYDFFLECAEEKFGKEIYSFLKNSEDDNVKVFYHTYQKSQAEESAGRNFKMLTVNDFGKTFKYNPNETKKAKVTIEQMLNRASELSLEADPNPFRIRPLARSFAKQANKEDLETLARLSVDEPSDFVKMALLRVFSFVDFPLDIELLLPYMISDSESLREIVIEALSRIKDKRIHTTAVNLFNESQVENAIKLLESNFEIEDEALIRKNILRSKRVAHGIIMSITDIYDEYKSSTCGDILLHLYKNIECTHCRCKVVEIMIKNTVMPENILIECQYDSYEDTRLLAMEELKNRKKQ